jgi:hypothetical protein
MAAVETSVVRPPSSVLDDILSRLTGADPVEREQAVQAALAATAHLPWVPNPGPQTAAYYSEADELLFGGEAGGGKTDLLVGVAHNEHQRARILRRVDKDVPELGDRLTAMLGSAAGYNSQTRTWKRKGKLLEFRGCQLERDKQRFKGKPRDFIGYDELADFLKSQYVFINTWNRSVDPSQRCRIIGATNGPTTPTGQWIVEYWGAWLNPNHPRPAKDGELRWYLSIGDVDVEVDGPGPYDVPGRPDKVRALSRTFIRSRLSDNPDLARTDYAARLEGLPEELRRVYRDGDFTVGLKDDDWQVIPTGWIEAAFARWTPNPPRGPMSAMAIDVAPGGGDQRVIGWRYGGWVAPLDAKHEKDKTGRVTAGEVVKFRRGNCPVVVDLGGGWGGDCLIALKDNGIECVAFNGVQAVVTRTRDGKLKFRNKRAEAVWRTREALDPSQEGGSVVALQPDPELKSDLASYRWESTIGGILIGDKDAQKEILGRSPDKGDCVVMLISEGQIAATRHLAKQTNNARPSRANVGHAHLKRGR